MALKDRLKKLEKQMNSSPFEIQFNFEGMPPGAPMVISRETWYKLRRDLLKSPLGWDPEKEHDKQDIAHSRLLVVEFTGENDLED
jgi:hypothetical protein